MNRQKDKVILELGCLANIVVNHLCEEFLPKAALISRSGRCKLTHIYTNSPMKNTETRGGGGLKGRFDFFQKNISFGTKVSLMLR